MLLFFLKKMYCAFYELPLWMQIYLQTETNEKVRYKLRLTSKIFNCQNLLINDIDIDFAKRELKLGWYMTNRDFILIADDSDAGCELYDYYNGKYYSASKFINIGGDTLTPKLCFN